MNVRSLCFLLALAVAVAVSVPAQAGPLRTTPAVEEVTSPGGIKAWLISSPRLPVISLRFAFRGGVEQDPADKQGLASLTSSLLTQGAGPYDSTAFQDRLAARSIKLEIGATRDALVGEMKTLRRAKDEAFRLTSLALTQPRFEAESFARTRDQQMTAMKFQIAKPAWQGRYALLQGLFGDHPYAYRSLGTGESLPRLTREEAAAFAKAHLAKDNLVVVAVGDLSRAELARALDLMFGALPAHAAPDPVPPASLAQIPATLIERDGAQTDIVFARPMMPRRDKDWPAATVANYLLGGGGFSSRLMDSVREKEGLTYGISTSLAPMDKASLLIGSLSTDNAKAGRAFDSLRRVWTDLWANGARADEVEAAKDYLTGSLPLSLTSTDAASGVLLSLALDGFDKDELSRREEKIKAVTVADVNRVLKEWFDPAAASFVFVGKPEGVDADRVRSLVEE